MPPRGLREPRFTGRTRFYVALGFYFAPSVLPLSPARLRPLFLVFSSAPLGCFLFSHLPVFLSPGLPAALVSSLSLLPFFSTLPLARLGGFLFSIKPLPRVSLYLMNPRTRSGNFVPAGSRLHDNYTCVTGAPTRSRFLFPMEVLYAASVIKRNVYFYVRAIGPVPLVT